MSRRPVSVVIPNWNGAAMLRSCLDSVRRALAFAEQPRPWEIVVADDGSTDGSVGMLREKYPDVQVLAAPERSGFIANANRGVRACSNPYFLLLNNDVTLHEEYLAHWEACFDDPDAFAVAGRLLRPDARTYDSGRRVGVWDRGLIRHWVVSSADSASPTLFASGGASIYDAQRFRALGGLDDLYRPMYVEDFDLSYRGWKRGWKTIYQPACLAYHHGSASSRQVYGSRALDVLVARNHYLFIWKNVTDRALTRQHVAWMPFWLAQAWRPGRRIVTLGLFRALARMGEALRKRARERDEQRVSDLDVWARFRPTPRDLQQSPYSGWAGTA